MVEALIRLFAGILYALVVQGLGVLILRVLRPGRTPSETACTVVGWCAFLVMIGAGIWWWRA